MADQDLSNKKQTFMARYVQIATEFVKTYEQLRALKDEWVSNGYATGIVQADINSGALLHLTPAIMATGMDAQEQLVHYMAGELVTRDDWQAAWHALVG
jgi:hypothetical protein